MEWRANIIRKIYKSYYFWIGYLFEDYFLILEILLEVYRVIVRKLNMSDIFDTCESNFLKSIRMVQRTLQETSDGSKLDEMNECLSDATQ